MVATERPLEEKMALFWHGHFASGGDKVRDYRKMLGQVALFQRLATGNFRELLIAVAQDPAMIDDEARATTIALRPDPLPDIPLKGMVTVKATLCYATKVDPHYPGNYTRAGLEVYFRPNEEVFKDDKAEHASTKSFFGKSRPRLTEDALRHDSWKWENCQHAQNAYRGRSLNAPVFDIHYNARSEGRNDTRSKKLKYALVVSVTAKRVPDLYDRVVRRYRTQLEALRPVIEIPVRVDTDDNEGSP